MKMLTKAKILLLLLASACAPWAIAGDLSPGLWEISLEARVPTETGWAPQPFTLTQCLTASDAKDPSQLVSSLSTQGASGCNFAEKNYSGGTFRFAMNCGGSYGLQTKGTISFGANSFNGTISAVANVGGKATEMQNQVAGKRVGGC